MPPWRDLNTGVGSKELKWEPCGRPTKIETDIETVEISRSESLYLNEDFKIFPVHIKVGYSDKLNRDGAIESISINSNAR